MSAFVDTGDWAKKSSKKVELFPFLGALEEHLWITCEALAEQPDFIHTSQAVRSLTASLLPFARPLVAVVYGRSRS